MSPEQLQRLSALLDEALDLAEPARQSWLEALQREDAELGNYLRDLLARDASGETVKLLHRGPAFQPPSVPDRTTGNCVGPYRLIREIGQGGMGTVWLAERADGSFQRKVALKLPRLAWGAGLAERMARERDIGALLEHPNIARLYDAGVDALGRPYLALEYIDGQPLDDWCRAQVASVRDRLRLFLQVARAVAYAHGRLVVHRDLKPSNVLVTPDAQVHLLDFGIAKLLHEPGPADAQLTQQLGQVLTPNYASPEQLKGETITVASDVYSLGVLLYELLTGRRPHASAGHSRAALEEAVLTEEPERASRQASDPSTAKALRGDLDAILGKALQRQPDQRYATADALAADIERHLAGQPVLAQPDRIGYRVGKAIRRHRLAFATTAAVLAAVSTGGIAAWVQASEANRAAERERVVKTFVSELFRQRLTVSTPGSVHYSVESLARIRFDQDPELQAEVLSLLGGKLVNRRLVPAALPLPDEFRSLNNGRFTAIIYLLPPLDPGSAPEIPLQERLHENVEGFRSSSEFRMKASTLTESESELWTHELFAMHDTLIVSPQIEPAAAVAFMTRVIKRKEDPRRVYDEISAIWKPEGPTKQLMQDQLRKHKVDFVIP